MAFKRVLTTLCLFTVTFALPTKHHHTANEGRAANISQTPMFTFDELYDLTNTFMEKYMYPANVKQAKKVNSTLFSTDVLGRVDATRNFVGRELNTEYIFGLFANIALNPNEFTILGYPVNFTFTHFTANQNIVSFATIVDYHLPATGTVVPQELDFWVTYNSQGQISQYDGTFRYAQWQIDTLLEELKTPLEVNSTTAVEAILQQKLAQSICTTAQTYCNGTNKQYSSLKACEQHLINDVRFGETYEWGMDTVTCRMIHQPMVSLRPDVHCPHIGPSGGGMCADDRTYVGNVLQEYFVNAPFVPYGKGDSEM